jgi:hypothetical protein
VNASAIAGGNISPEERYSRWLGYTGLLPFVVLAASVGWLQGDLQQRAAHAGYLRLRAHLSAVAVLSLVIALIFIQ